jgi:RimJ/RimL family protein N-acetyltransferase
VITVEQCANLDIIQELVQNPHVFNFRSLCDGVDVKNFRLPDGLYLLARSEHGPLGMFYLHAQNPILWQVHVAFLPHAWGKPARTAGLLGIDWLAQKTACRKMIALIPEFNRAALGYVERIGGILEGRIRHGAMKEGTPVNELVYGITVKQ